MATVTTEKLRELSAHVVTLPGFEWLPRMREIEGATCCKVLNGAPWLWFVDDCVTEHDDEPCFPDLSDPGTQGCVIELIARNNLRRSKSDALQWIAHAMRRGLSIEEALVYELEHSFATVAAVPKTEAIDGWAQELSRAPVDPSQEIERLRAEVERLNALVDASERKYTYR